MPAAPPLYSVVPFIAMLLAIALGPLALPRWWEAHRHKLTVSVALGLPVLGFYLVRQPSVLAATAGRPAALPRLPPGGAVFVDLPAVAALDDDGRHPAGGLFLLGFGTARARDDGGAASGPSADRATARARDQ